MISPTIASIPAQLPPMPRSLRCLSLAAGLALAACAPKSTTRAPRADRQEISLATIRERNFANAYDAVAALHSNWLNTRGSDSFNSPTQVWVYVDDNRVGGVDALKEIAAVHIGYIHYYDGLAATARWGVGHGAGVIYVSSSPR